MSLEKLLNLERERKSLPDFEAQFHIFLERVKTAFCGIRAERSEGSGDFPPNVMKEVYEQFETAKTLELFNTLVAEWNAFLKTENVQELKTDIDSATIINALPTQIKQVYEELKAIKEAQERDRLQKVA